MLALLLAFAATSSGCKKESLAAPRDGNSTDALALPDTECEKDGDCTSMLCMLDDPYDADNKKINMITFHYAQAVKAAMANPTLRCELVNAAIADEGGFGVSLHKLASGNATLASTLNTALRQSMSANNIYPRGYEAGVDALIASTSWDANSYLKSRMTYGSNETYEPVIYFVKKPASCTTSEPISVIIGEEVNCCDEVPGWKDGTFTLFDEAEIMASTAINIFVGEGTPMTAAQLAEMNPTFISKEAGNQVDLRVMNIDIDTDRHQIKNGFRYENNCKSEVSAWVLKYIPSSLNPNSLGFWTDFDTKKIHKDDINASKIFTDDQDAFTMSQSDFDAGRQVFIGAWEKDWGKSPKLVVNTCSPWVGHSVAIKMKYSHEWYFFDCGVLSSWFPSVNDHRIESNEKCMFDLVRKM